MKNRRVKNLNFHGLFSSEDFGSSKKFLKMGKGKKKSVISELGKINTLERDPSDSGGGKSPKKNIILPNSLSKFQSFSSAIRDEEGNNSAILDTNRSLLSTKTPKSGVKRSNLKKLTDRSAKKLKNLKNKIFGQKYDDYAQFSFMDFMSTLVPDSVYNSEKKQLFKKGKEMINQKLDIGTIIKSLNELEKLKLVLFDANQYRLFEEIPKPILMHRDLLEIKNKKIGNGKPVLSCYGQFWEREELSEEEKIKTYNYAFGQIKMKNEHDIIDLRLMKILDNVNEL